MEFGWNLNVGTCVCVCVFEELGPVIYGHIIKRCSGEYPEPAPVMMPVWTKLGVFDFSQRIQRHENKEAWAAYRAATCSDAKALPKNQNGKALNLQSEVLMDGTTDSIFVKFGDP